MHAIAHIKNKSYFGINTQTLSLSLSILSSLHSFPPVQTGLLFLRSDLADLHSFARSLCQYGIMQKFDSQFSRRHLSMNTELALGSTNLAELNSSKSFQMVSSSGTGSCETGRGDTGEEEGRKGETDVCPASGVKSGYLLRSCDPLEACINYSLRVKRLVSCTKLPFSPLCVLVLPCASCRGVE